MRTNKFLFGLMAIGTLFSCTNDGSDFETPVAGQVETSYIAINVNSAYDVTRANGYEDGTFRPASTLTRAQAAKLIYGLIK